MSKNLKKHLKKSWFMISASCLVFLVSFFAYTFYKASTTPPDGSDPNVIAHFWNQQIKVQGGEKAYQNLKQKYLRSSSTQAHLVAHVFGEELYKQTGLNGFTSCNSDFNYGCYHGFFTSAVVAEGDGVTEKLFRLCQDKFGSQPTACEHGIGHGLYEYYGSKRLHEALEKCALIQQNPLLGCSSGVFMEHNFPSFNTITSLPRPIDQQDLYGPCHDIPESFMLSCLYELPSYWNASTISFPKIIELCQELTSSHYTQACIRGAGLATTKTSYPDLGVSTEKCRLFTAINDQQMCFEGAFWGFLSRASAQEAAKICDVAPDPARCKYNGDLHQF